MSPVFSGNFLIASFSQETPCQKVEAHIVRVEGGRDRDPMHMHRADQNKGGALLETGLLCTGKLAFRLQYLFAITDKISKLVSQQWW